MLPRFLLQRSRGGYARAHGLAGLAASPARSQLRSRPLPPPPASARRWYTTEPDATRAQAQAEVKESESGPEPEPAPVSELEAKEKLIINLKDKLLQSIADFRNLQERTKRDMQAARDFAISKFAKDLIDSVDNLDRALSNVPQDKLSAAEKSEDLKDLVSLYEGLKMTENILMATLKKHGLERFDPSVESQKFDPNEHEAVFMTPVQGKENNTVFHTQQKGFKLNGRVLRAAKVGVVKNP